MKNKQKTHKASKKRFKVTAKGKLMHGRQKDNAHLNSKQSRNQKARKKGREALQNSTETKKIIELI